MKKIIINRACPLNCPGNKVEINQIEQAKAKIIKINKKKYWEIYDHDNMDGPEIEEELILHADKWETETNLIIYIPNPLIKK